MPHPISWPHLVVLREGQRRPPLILIAGQEGHALVFRRLAACLDAEQPLYGVELIGSDGDEPEACSIEDMASVFEMQIVAACPTGPIAVGGYSMGAAIAFEVALRLASDGRSVPLLVSLDGFAPGFHRTLVPSSVHLKRHLRVALGRAHSERLRAMRDRLVKTLPRRFRGPPPWSGEDDVRKRVLATSRFDAVMRYRPAKRLATSLLLVRSSHYDDELAPKIRDPLYGWERFVDGPIIARTVEGIHLTLLDFDSANRAIGSLVTTHLAACRAGPASAPEPCAKGAETWNS